MKARQNGGILAWGRTDFTRFPANLVEYETLPRGGFAPFSSSVYEDLKTHTRLFHFKNHSGQIANDNFFWKNTTKAVLFK